MAVACAPVTTRSPTFCRAVRPQGLAAREILPPPFTNPAPPRSHAHPAPWVHPGVRCEGANEVWWLKRRSGAARPPPATSSWPRLLAPPQLARPAHREEPLPSLALVGSVAAVAPCVV
ncbi:Hypothetical predicted protein [Podarcis lilfordi]|uniref:Uncharacterized protein n=1 Tax=Podarcis lilfordi TaxID=74358 RepID=A0AA35K667_9SAUR|nr:Hypothetical predicted protein [Podarcis lilfordi]